MLFNKDVIIIIIIIIINSGVLCLGIDRYLGHNTVVWKQRKIP